MKLRSDMMNILNYKIDEDVKLIRELLNLSQEQFAQKIGVDAITVARWETGKICANENNVEKIYMLLQIIYL